jgi:hypothetical protein
VLIAVLLSIAATSAPARAEAEVWSFDEWFSVCSRLADEPWFCFRSEVE